MMKTVVVGNLKGGVGKSTTVINLAFIFSTMGKRVLVIDDDPQSNATSIYAKVNSHGNTLKDIVTNNKPISSCVYRTKYPNIDIIKGDTYLKESDVGEMGWLIDVCNEIGERYDICLIDTRPAFEKLTESVLIAADVYLTPIYLDEYCKDNLPQVEEFIEDFVGRGMKWLIFANMVDFRRKSQKEIYADLKEKHIYPFMETCVSDSAAIENALKCRKPVIKHRSKSAGALDYIELAEELLECLDEEV